MGRGGGEGDRDVNKMFQWIMVVSVERNPGLKFMCLWC